MQCAVCSVQCACCDGDTLGFPSMFIQNEILMMYRMGYRSLIFYHNLMYEYETLLVILSLFCLYYGGCQFLVF